MLPKKLQDKLTHRKGDNALRQLGKPNQLIDFASNDYLGFSRNKEIFNNVSKILQEHDLEVNGATGSRLLSGNHQLYNTTEATIANFHHTESALIFNSGYDANLGFFSCIPQRGDIIFYDELCHASIRDGIKMSNAKAYKFPHNNLEKLRELLSVQKQLKIANQAIYIVTESVFSMDGDQPDLKTLVALCKDHNCYLIVDEAHALGVFGEKGEGLVQKLGLENDVFVRIVTFGKALGCHGAAILGSKEVKQYLINFSRPFIYTTGLSPHSVATILASYKFLSLTIEQKTTLNHNIAILQKKMSKDNLNAHFIKSTSAIHSCIIPGNKQVKEVALKLQEVGFDVKSILSPTVAVGQERLRICLHSYNTTQEIKELLQAIQKNIASVTKG